MATPRPQDRKPWTPADDEENSRRIQADADRRTWDRLGRRLGFRGRELTGLLTRFFDDRIQAALRYTKTLTLEQLNDPEQADAFRGPIVDLLIGDLTELVTILTRKEKKNDTKANRSR